MVVKQVGFIFWFDYTKSELLSKFLKQLGMFSMTSTEGLTMLLGSSWDGHDNRNVVCQVAMRRLGVLIRFSSELYHRVHVGNQGCFLFTLSWCRLLCPSSWFVYINISLCADTYQCTAGNQGYKMKIINFLMFLTGSLADWENLIRPY